MMKVCFHQLIFFKLDLVKFYICLIGVSGTNMGDMFMWMPKEQLYVVVYLVTVMHSVQAGYMDKAQKYTDKALVQIEKLKGFISNLMKYFHV